jgi:2-(1,2-epoxy-1,2-dihydrophenyl)acetyl-CoA isomerase
MTNIVTYTDDAVGVITIDRKERFNSLDVETARDLRKAGLAFARDANVRAVVLRGVPGIFCSGADLKYIRGGGDAEGMGYLKPAAVPSKASDLPTITGEDPSPSSRLRMSVQYGDVFKQILEYIHSTISEIRRAPKPFIAAVDGMAAAGGFGLAMSCDLVVASERASFEWAYSKTGLTGAESSTFFLPRLVGLRRAMELLLLNPRLDARKALEYGLITAVFPNDTFDDEVMMMARRLAEGPTEALGIAKDLMNQAAGMDRLDYHLDRELDQLARIANGEQFAEGLSAFFEKRAPQFK